MQTTKRKTLIEILRPLDRSIQYLDNVLNMRILVERHELAQMHLELGRMKEEATAEIGLLTQDLQEAQQMLHELTQQKEDQT